MCAGRPRWCRWCSADTTTARTPPWSPSRRASQELEQFAREREWNILGKVPTAVAFKNTPEPPAGVVTHSSSSPAAHAIRYLTDQIVEATK